VIVYRSPQNVAYLLRDQEECAYFAASGGSPEQPLIDWAKQFLSPDRSFIDCGAHIGTWSVQFAPHCNQVHAFEAQRSTFYRLCGDVALNDCENVTAYHAAMNDGTREWEDLRIVSVDGGGSSIHPAHPSSVSALAFEKVPARCLNQVLASDVGLVKLDVEGAELATLKGAQQMLRRNHWPRLLFECWRHDWFRAERAALFEFVGSLGYQILPITGWPEMFLAEHRP
jgi:FkbM family methyltransferase